MAKRGSYQKSKERKKKILNVCFVILIILVSSAFLWGIIESAVTVYNIDNGTLDTYTGRYNHKIEYRHRQRAIYIFKLDNGDTLAISSVHLQNTDKLVEFDKLSFCYSNVRISLDGKYPAVSIASEDGAVSFLSAEDIRNDDIGKVCLLSILLVILLLLCAVLPIVFFKLSHVKHKKRKISK